MGLLDRLFKSRKTKAAPESQLAELAARFPFPVSSVPGDQVDAEILRLRNQADSNVTPVIVGGYQDAIRLLDLFDQPFDFEASLALAKSLSILGSIEPEFSDSFLTQRHKEHRERHFECFDRSQD